MKRYLYYLLYLLFVWGSFRYFVRLPEVIEELWFKPVIWLLPVFLLNSLYDRVKFFEKNNTTSFLVGLLIGLFYLAILGVGGRTWGFDLNWFGVVFAVSIVEELTFSGYWARYLEKKSDTYKAIALVGLGVLVVRLPIWFGVFGLNYVSLIGAALFSFGFGVVHAWLRLKTSSVLGSLVARVCMMLTF